MQPIVASVPSTPRHYAFELNPDGFRILCYHDGEKIMLRDSNGADPTTKFPELIDLARFLDKRRTILDGHIVVLDQGGRPDPIALRRRLRADQPPFSLVEQNPIRFVISDLLFDRGRWILHLPFTDRRARLDRISLNGLFWQTVESNGHPTEMIKQARKKNLPAIIAKKLESPYEPGRKSQSWLQIPTRQ